MRSSTTTTQGKPRYLIFRDSRHSLYFRELLYVIFFYQDYIFIAKISPRGDFMKDGILMQTLKKCTNSHKLLHSRGTLAHLGEKKKIDSCKEFIEA